MDSTGPFSHSAYLYPLYCDDLRCLIILESEPPRDHVEALWPLFNCILFLNYKLISGQPRFKVKDMGPDFLMRE